MDVSSLAFLAFAGVVALLYHAWRNTTWRQVVLLAANMAFLATVSHQAKSFLPFVGFLLVGYAGIRFVQAKKSSVSFVVLVVCFVFVFVWLKQYRFLPGSMFLPFTYITIGLSYIFFRVLHVVIDAHEGSLTCRLSFVSYLNYTLNFTCLVAGPIQMYPDYAQSQLETPAPWPSPERALAAGERILLGFFKVRVLSMFLLLAHGAAIRRLSAEQAARASIITGGMVAALYLVYLYFNFSGYCDMMIGAGSFLGMDLPENFDRPFATYNFIEFWGHWHMTLSNWLKTYVYSPLLKNLMARYPDRSVEPFLGIIAFFVTFFLVGVWHGQTSEFLFFGVLQGLGVSLNKLYQVLMGSYLGRKRFKALRDNRVYRSLARGLTFSYFCFTSLWFWSNWAQLHGMARALGPLKIAMVWLAVWICSAVVLSIWETAREWALNLRWSGTPVLTAAPVRAAWSVYLGFISAMILSDFHATASILYQIF